MFLLGCAPSESLKVDLESKLDRAKTLFNDGKYSKAKAHSWKSKL